ncbi:MAG: 2Fe-2S iron-sulfur cluster-binding protein [Sterolibacterium sp.]|jgi:NADH dehydrogenase/NADH:ubiquinone oxidoreductase subunit G
MSEIVLKIDDQEVKATAGMTVLQAAQQAGIYIPTLCHHEKLEAFGGCRLCMVEVESRGWTSYVVSCLYPVAKDIVVRTRSAKVDKIRKVLVEELMAHAPDAPELVKLAEEYGADRDRFERKESFCVVCGLCVRYCNEVKQKNAVGFIDNGAKREISFIPEVAKKECWDCQECFALCPTSYAQAAYLLTEALAFPGQRREPVQVAKAPEPARRVIPIIAA